MEKRRQPREKWTEEMIADVIDLYTNKGWTMKRISEIYSTKRGTISAKLKENGIQTLSGGTTKNRLLRHDYFETIDTEAKAYFLGLILADGSVSQKEDKRSQQISIGLHTQDADILKVFAKELRYEGAFQTDNRGEGVITISFRSSKMANDLAKYGIVPRKTYVTNHLPLDMIPADLQPHFLRGFMDGDGSIYVSRSSLRVSFTGHSGELINEVRDLGYELINTPCNAKTTLYNGVSKFTFNGSKAERLLSTLYTDATIFFPRKKNVYDNHMAKI